MYRAWSEISNKLGVGTVVQSPSFAWLFATPWAAGLPVYHHIAEFAQIHVLCIGDGIQSSFSVIPFFCLQSFPASGSFPMTSLFTSGDQSIGTSDSTSVLLMSIQGWFPLRLSVFDSLLSKEITWDFSSTTVWKHQCFSTVPSLQSISHSHTWQLERPQPLL